MSFIHIHRASLAVCVTALMLGSGTVSASDAAAFTEQSLIAQGAQISHHRLTGQANFIGTKAGNAIALPGTGTTQNPSAVAMDALNSYGMMFGLGSPTKELRQKSLKTVGNGRSVVRYQQIYNGIPVIGGELIVNLSANNGLLSINGEIAPKLAVPTTAAITAKQAGDTALNAVAKWHKTTASALNVSTPVLSVYDPKLVGPDNYPASLVWHVEVSSTTQQPIRELVLIDAQRGHIALHFNQIDTALVRETYTAAETAANPGNLVCNESDPTCAAGDTDAQNAHLFAKDTYDFYSTNHARDSIDNAGMTLISTTHWDDGSSCPNAFWDGSRMVYCTGMVVDDVVAHELTHGVTERESNLFYYYQSGAINESLSDVWGEFVDLGNSSGDDSAASKWLMGEDLNIPGMTGAIRSMKDPTLFGDPDKMSSAYYWTSATDGGGVHTNSGINNKAVYLMVDGDSFNGTTVSGIGITKVATIYYEVQTNILTSGADYLDLYNALYQGCQNVIGTAGITAADCNQVRAATNAVEMNIEPSTNFNPDPGACPGESTPSNIVFSDDMEGVFTNWTFTNVGGTDWIPMNATYAIPYATSGIESLLGEDVAATSDQRAAISVTLPAGQSYLHFRHAIEFEPNYDGAVLEYSTDSGTTWVDAGSLIEAGKDYNGTLLAGNPMAGRSAFTGTSHGYVATRLNLLSLAGQTVMFRWRVGTDSSVGSYGWFLDDVSVVSGCPTPASVAFSAATYSVAENAGTATITVSRTGSSSGSATVKYATSSGTATAGIDFSSTLGTLNWADGDMTDKTFTVTILDDSQTEGSETVNLTLSNPTGSVLGSSSTAVLTITDVESSGGGGGGALGWPFLLLSLLLLPLRRRFRLTA